MTIRILQLGKFYYPALGGIETVIKDITEYLNFESYQCDVLCSNTSNTYEIIQNQNYFIMKTKSWFKISSTSISPQMIFKLRQIIKNYDIIHVHLPDPMANLALFFSPIDRQKIVLHWHSDILKQKKTLWFYLPLQKWLLRKSDKIIATSSSYANNSKYLNVFLNKVNIIPIGINTQRLQYPDKPNGLKRFNGYKIIFSVGRFSYYKGFEYLIRSATYLPDDYKILISGDGGLRNELLSIISQNNLESKVILLGRLSDKELAYYYSICDVFCLSSIERTEAFGVVLLEAMMFGKPLVTTKILGSGVIWVNQHKITGLHVAKRNSIALSNAFCEICENPAKQDYFSKNSFKRFQNTFTVKCMMDKIINLYRNL